MRAGNSEITKGLLDIVRADASFDPNHFLQGAKAAYEIIVTAFAEGNRKTLKDLLNPEVYEGFSSAIAERENRGEQIDQSFVASSRPTWWRPSSRAASPSSPSSS